MDFPIRAIVLAVALAAGGCAHLESIYRPAETVALKSPPPPPEDTRCEAIPAASSVPYDLGHLKDCTAPDTFVLFAFSGGGIRSAAFGYGALTAAHGTKLGDDKHSFSQDIDVVSGVSGGSFTAAAFASHRERLFPAAGAKDYYRDNFLTHDFFADLLSIYFAPWHWQWMLPNYSSQDELAKIYAAMPFSGPSDPVFAKSYGDLAKAGRPMLVVQATDFGNEQPFTFTQPDFDLICSDLNEYPLGNAVAASSAFPVLFTPIRLTNHHFDGNGFCTSHRPEWVDRILDAPEPEDLSRLYSRARVASTYLPPKPGTPKPKGDPPRSVFLQDGGVTDNVALRGFGNTALPYLGENGAAWSEEVRAGLCRSGWDRIRHIAVVIVDGEAQPSNQVASLPYLNDLLLILNVTSSAMIDANGFETMLATDALTKQMAVQFKSLNCGNSPPADVKAWFARVSFQDLAEDTALPPEACDRHAPEGCTLGDVARSDTSLDFSEAQVDALVAAGRSAFACNLKLKSLLTTLNATPATAPPLPCRPRKN
jgi:predicted acylesterase/phospholipase RssA